MFFGIFSLFVLVFGSKFVLGKWPFRFDDPPMHFGGRSIFEEDSMALLKTEGRFAKAKRVAQQIWSRQYGTCCRNIASGLHPVIFESLILVRDASVTAKSKVW